MTVFFRMIARAATTLAVCCAALTASALELTIDPRSAGLDEAVTITVTLEGDFARLDEVELPLSNLTIESGPSVSSQFEWKNGVTSRQKIFRWTAYGEVSGPASAGPVRLESSGKTAVLPRVAVRILPDPMADVRTPEDAVRRLLEADRELVFLLPEIDRAEVFTGEQVVITWYLYTAETIRDFDISSTPSLRDFWVEEIPLTDEPTREVRIAGISLQRIPVRRVALFPLQSGKLSGGKLVAVAEVMRPIRDAFGIFSRIERSIGRIVLRAPAPEVIVNALPPGAESDAVGRFAMSCSDPRAPEQGPVSFEVAVSGEGNLRSARQPRFSSDPDARVEVQEGGVTVERTAGRVRMSRKWTFILFPRRTGRLAVPAVEFRAWNPSQRSLETLRCPGRQVAVKEVFADAPAEPAQDEAASDPSRRGPALAVAALVVLSLAIIVLLVRSRMRGRRVTRRLMRHAENPASLRAELHEIVAAGNLTEEELLKDDSELGEAYRALRSLLDIRERETLTADRSPRELERRVRELARELERGR